MSTEAEVLQDAVTSAQIEELRRMVAEPSGTATTYTDVLLREIIAKYPVPDEWGEDPYLWWPATTPPSQYANRYWAPTYDLNAAAGDIWQEKAAAVAGDFTFQADGSTFNRSQVYEQYMKQCRYYRSRRVVRTVRAVKHPRERSARLPVWIGNLPEPEVEGGPEW
jgi:hypothetical protein